MAIQTNIDVSAFNIIRYLVLNVVIDIIVRKSLDSFEHFRRRLSLYRGQSVSLAGYRIDRYNLLRTLTSGHLVSASLLFLITALAYGVEVALEYAVDSNALRHPTRGNITRVEQTTGVCSLDEVFTSDNSLDLAFMLAFMAGQCVRFEDGMYRFYHPIWTRDMNGTLRVLCEAVEENMVYEGDGMYGHDTTSREPPEALKLIRTLSENSHETVGDAWHSLFVLNVTSADVFERRTFATPFAQFSTTFFQIEVGSTVKCIGFTSGIQGQDTMVLELVGCVDGFDEDSSLLITFGTNLVKTGVEEWSTPVPFSIRTRVKHYFRGMRAGTPNSQANANAYASFLARASPIDVINLNKYAILYRHCDQITIPLRNGTTWEEEHDFASSDLRVTATVEEWGLILAACWVIAVAVGQLVVRGVAARKKMPTKVFGERHILRRWAAEVSGEQLPEAVECLLSVEQGPKTSRITATLRRRQGNDETMWRDEVRILHWS